MIIEMMELRGGAILDWLKEVIDNFDVCDMGC